MSGIVPHRVVVPLVDACSSGQFSKMQSCVTDLMCRGYPATETLKTLSTLLLPSPSLRDVDKATVSITIAQASKFLVDGADEELQVMNVAAGVVRAFQESRKAEGQ